MPTSAEAPTLLDTSAAVALVVADHEHHRRLAAAVRGRRLGLAGHAAFETFSVLTRLPAPLRRSPPLVRSILEDDFPDTRFLSREATRALFGRLTELGLGGGSVYDALVGATAVEHGLRLLTRDRRAMPVYQALQVDLEVLP